MNDILILIILVIAIPLLSWWKKALTIHASLIAGGMIVISSIPGIRYAYYIVLAFLLVSVFGKVFSNSRVEFADENYSQKNGTRDSIQVLANGGVAMLATLLWIITRQPAFLIGFLSSLAESFGDSMASTIGIARGGKVYDICSLKPLPSGISGGISIAGSLGCLLSCIVMSVISYAMGLASPKIAILIAVSAYIGCIFDSILGSCLQRKNRCDVCGTITEKETHCGIQTKRVSGINWLDNDAVNLLSNLFTACLSCAGVFLCGGV